MSDFFGLYDCLIDNIVDDFQITRAYNGERWSCGGDEGHFGLAMGDKSDSVPPMFPDGIEGKGVKEAARGIKSWNLKEASLSLGAMNGFYNSSKRLNSLNCAEPFDNYYTRGMNFEGKTVGLVGHLNLKSHVDARIKKIYTLERAPRQGDYPDSACDYILPMCDIVIITGGTICNKTLPHLLELCKNAYTVLTGPSVPMCRDLFDFGIDRLAGLVVEDYEGMFSKVKNGERGNPYIFGQSFLLIKD